MDRITRKELKSDAFAQELGLTVNFFEQHRADVIRYGGIGLAAVVLIAGFIFYTRHQRDSREHALAAAIAIQESPVNAAGVPNSFPSQEAKDAAAIKSFSDVAAKGGDEGQIANYYLGAILADQGKMSEAEKHFKDVAQNASAPYASLAKLSLAEIYYSDGRTNQGDEVLRDVMDHPTAFVSKDEAALTLAKHLAGRNPSEARKLLGPIKDGKGPAATMAQVLYSELPPQ